MRIVNKFRNNPCHGLFETARKESNGQSKSALFKQITGDVTTGPIFKLCDYELREQSVMCTMELMKDGSAVKKEMKGKKVSVWVAKVPKQLFVGRTYLLLNCELS